MPLRQKTGSIVCPSCGRLVGVRDASCYGCGRTHPGLFGFAPLLGRFGRTMTFGDIVFWGCGALFLITLLVDFEKSLSGGGGIMSMLSPPGGVLFVFGSSGAFPIFGYGRFWTVLSAAWLHGGLLHIFFNMMYVRQLISGVESIFGLGRTIIIYTVSAIAGFGLTSTIALLSNLGPLAFLPGPLHGANMTVGASASLCGLAGALFAYSRVSLDYRLQSYAKQSILVMIAVGFLMSDWSGKGQGFSIDNWAHLGGALGGYVSARLLRPLERESAWHLVGGLICLGLTALALILSIVHGLPIYRELMARANGG